jgi:hypothetical protein
LHGRLLEQHRLRSRENSPIFSTMAKPSSLSKSATFSIRRRSAGSRSRGSAAVASITAEDTDKRILAEEQ